LLATSLVKMVTDQTSMRLQPLRLLFLISVMLASALTGSPDARAASVPAQTLESIREAAEAFVRAHLAGSAAKHYVSAGRLDPRLRLAACGAPLETFAQSPNGARIVVGVRCATGNPWTLYVPVAVEVEASVLVLRRALPRLARVDPADVEPQLRRLPGSAATFVSDISALQGHRLKRAVPVGTALTVDMLAPDVLVRRGQQVTLLASSDLVEIRARGEALSEGRADERVRVRNLTSLKVVEGVVESEHVVRVGP
jgi:flagella basal body P-ring formation protein FlgA